MVILFFCIWLGSGMLKSILFPLSGALAIFFFFIAKSGQEHILCALFYLMNQLSLCFLTSNYKAAISILYIHMGFLLVLTILTLFVEIDWDNNLKRSKFKENFILILLEGKIKIFFAFFGLIFGLLPASGIELWVRALAKTLFCQIGFINIIYFLSTNIERKNK